MTPRDALLLALRYPVRYWPLSIAGFFAVVLAALGAVHVQTVNEQESLREEIARLSGIVAGEAPAVAEVEARLEEKWEEVPPPDLTEIQVFRAMRGLAAEAGIPPNDPDTFTVSHTGTSARTSLGQNEYQSLSFLVTATGDPDAVRELVRRLDQGETPFPTLVVTSAALTPGGGGDGQSASARLELRIYTRPASG